MQIPLGLTNPLNLKAGILSGEDHHLLKFLNIIGIPKGAKELIKRLCVNTSTLKYLLWSDQKLHASTLPDTKERKDLDGLSCCLSLK